MSTRSFIALNLDEPIRQALTQAADQIGQPPGSKVNWTAPENLHVTVKFLGEVHDAILPDICRIAREAVETVEPFTFSVSGVLTIPPQGPRPRMFWAGVEDPDGRIATIFHSIEEGLATLGFGRDRRPFRAHVTMARIRRVGDPAAIHQLAADRSALVFGESNAESLTVFGSELTPRGPVYTPLATATLGG
jgi:2'-5' RNA ligase